MPRPALDLAPGPAHLRRFQRCHPRPTWRGPCHWASTCPSFLLAPCYAVPWAQEDELPLALPARRGQQGSLTPVAPRGPPPRSCITWGCRPVVNLSPLKGSLRHIPCTAPSGGQIPGAGSGAGPGLGPWLLLPHIQVARQGQRGESALVVPLQGCCSLLSGLRPKWD